MGHIVFAAPGIARFHLHDRLARELVQRGHEVQALSLDPVAHTFWRTQVRPAVRLLPEAPDAMRAPLDDLAERECARLGIRPGDVRYRARQRRVARRLAGLLPAVVRWLSCHRPGLALLCGARTAERQLLHFVARELGIRVLWAGDGLLPHTLQVDERGLDGDASSARREPFDYRAVRAEPALLEACLAHALAKNAPFGLSRSEVAPPPLWARLGDGLAALSQGFAGVRHALRGWLAAAAPGDVPAAREDGPPLPESPFVAVLLQAPDDERLRLDAEAPPAPVQLVRATVQAARELDVGLRTVAVLPAGGLHHRDLGAILRLPGVTVVPATRTPETAAMAVATTTVNHPGAILALLAGTPVLHTGRALYGLPTVTHRVPAAVFGPVLRDAAAGDGAATLRQRFLTWLLGHTHLWCSATLPDHNGLVGLVQEIEGRLAETRPRGLGLHYRTGPAWPLSV